MFASVWQVLPHDEAGSGPAVVLLHAGIADRTMWAEHLDPLAQAGYRAVAMDLSGFGEAAVAAGEQAPWIDVLATMDAAEIHEAVIVGNSFGRAVALRAAVLAPQRVSALALISAPAPGVDPSPELEAACAVEESALERGDLDGAELLATTLPNARLEVIEGAGHLAPLETPEAFRALLLDFLTT